MKKSILSIALVAIAAIATSSCRENEPETTVVKEREVIIEKETVPASPQEERKGALERAAERIDDKVNKEIDEEIDKIGDDN